MPTPKTLPLLPAVAACCLLAACSTDRLSGYEAAELQAVSPDGRLRVRFAATADSALTYTLERVALADNTVLPEPVALVEPSGLGFVAEGLGEVTRGLVVEGVANRAGRETYELPWGEVARVDAGYAEMQLSLKHVATGLRFDVVARLFDDGLGLRYAFPEQDGLTGFGGSLDTLRVLEERTGFRVGGDPLVNWGPGDWNSYENPVLLTRLSEIEAEQYDARDQLISRVVPHNAVMTPATMRLADGTHLSIHEAALIDYPETTLGVDEDRGGFTTILAGTERREAKAVRALPFATPWRTIAVEHRAADLLANTLVLNLNPPNELGDVSWFEPTTYAGVWWEMHLGVGTWDLAGGSTSPTPEAAAIMASRGVSSRHAANTANVKRYVDFCADNDIGGLLVEGWNTGWEVWLDPEERADVFDFVTPYPDYDLEEVVRYARERDVEIVMHHETSAAVPQYEKQQDTAFALMQRLGIHTVKSGYVGNILPAGEYHHGQHMVRHYRETLRKAARYEVAVNPHEGIKPTGERRTLPNAISSETAKGMEYNSNGNVRGGGVNPPSHVPGLVYTRCLGGPFDYTPGIFRLDLADYRGEGGAVGTTLGHQLGAYVAVYAPIQMVADLPEHYRTPDGAYHPAMAFIRELAVDWDATYPLAGELGDYVVVARKVRGEDRYYIGGLAGDTERTVTVPLDFLPAPSTGSGQAPTTYTGTLWADAADTDYRTNPEAYVTQTLSVMSADSLTVTMKPAGGFAVVLGAAN